ncbi:MAG: formate dehydrogenase accessory sulfurtransferase FdhD [Steroidobacteraceae bacterium]
MSALNDPVSVTHEIAVERWRSGTVEQVTDHVAEEVPVALVYQGIPHAVMLATPADLVDLAYGFTLSEQLVGEASEIASAEAQRREDGYEVRIGIPAARFSELLRRQRNLTGRTGCGLCGVEKIEDAIRAVRPVEEGVRVSIREMHLAIERLKELQQINLKTGSVHAAAWVQPGEGIQIVREDVGRHNALDKVIGAVSRANKDFSSGYLLVTSRASFEMVQKAAVVGATCLVAVSAPTAFAVRLATQNNLTLVGFARQTQHVVYAHPQRLIR